MCSADETRLSKLQNQVEKALIIGRPYQDILPILERLANESPHGSRFQLFAYRRLAELHLDSNSWKSALYLKRLIDLGIVDDSVFALMGLCQTLLGNYHSAVAAYQRALELAPDNPWYHHNLGHLLDMGMGKSEQGIKHLRIAHRLESRENEITASLAHCLARLGKLEEAKKMAQWALDAAPYNIDHKALFDWIQQGAPVDSAPVRATQTASASPDRYVKQEGDDSSR